MIGKDFNDREKILLGIRKWCALYFEGDCADAIALYEINKILTNAKKRR